MSVLVPTFSIPLGQSYLVTGEKNTEQKELHQLPFSNILFNISINIETICPAIGVGEVDSQMLLNEWKLKFLRSVEWREVGEGKPGNVTASSLDDQLVAADCLKTESLTFGAKLEKVEIHSAFTALWSFKDCAK